MTKKAPKNNNYLINNIISSELACYEDIANNFDKAINEYKRDSEFLRAYNTKIGKALTEQQLVGEGFNIAKVPAANIPATPNGIAGANSANPDIDDNKKLSSNFFCDSFGTVASANFIFSFIFGTISLFM